MTSTYEIRTLDNTPMAVEIDDDGRVIAAASVGEENLVSMNLTSTDQVDIEKYLGANDKEGGQYAAAQYDASILFGRSYDNSDQHATACAWCQGVLPVEEIGSDGYCDSCSNEPRDRLDLFGQGA
ncbi:MAG: hypothetical protein ACT4OM_13480 [Actinomycetota bacterium]